MANPDDNGRTPLHLAAWDGSAERVAALLEAGADPDAPDAEGQTPAGLNDLAMMLDDGFGAEDDGNRQKIAGMLKGASEARALGNEALPGKDAKARKV